MCGAETKLFKAVIEGTHMNVCRDCSQFGRVTGEVSSREIKETSKKQTYSSFNRDTELIQKIVEDYSSIVKSGREKLGLTQKEFAMKINEKESLVHKIETGSFEPNLSLARKLEKFLKIKLVEQHELEKSYTPETKSDSFTIGDFIKTKKQGS